MTADIKPALTAEEWKSGWVYAQGDPGAECGEHVHRHANCPESVCVAGLRSSACISDDGLRHALAALCLHRQPFGFTHEDVAMLRVMASPPDVPPFMLMINLADRIAALLPPVTQ